MNMMKPLFLFTKDESETKVANNRLFSYAAGLAGQNMTYNYISSRLFVFLNTIMSIPSAKTGVITGVSALWDAVNDPLIGSIMDHRKYKTGNKMRPFLLWTPLIIGILSVLMFADFGFSQSGTIIYVLIIYLLFDMFYSFQDIAIWGLSALSTPSSQERIRVIQWISIGAGAGSTIASVFPMLKDFLLKTNLISEKNIYFLFAVLFGFGGMAMSMLSYRMKEKVDDTQEKKTNILKAIWNLRHNKTLIIVCLARTVQCLSLSLPWEYFFESKDVAFNFFGKTFTGGTAMFVYGVVMGIPGAVANFFTVPTIKKLGSNKRLLVLAETLNITTRILAFAVGANDRYKSFAVIMVVTSLIGTAQIFTNMKGIAERALLTNSVDEVELKTGERTEGITFSMQNFVSKLTSALPKFIQGYFLQFLGFNESLKDSSGNQILGNELIKAQTSERFLKYRWHQFILGPVIGAVLYLAVILFLDDNPAHVAEVEAALKKKREAALNEEKSEATA